MFSDRQAYTNSIDLYHSAPREAVCSGSSLFIIPCTFLDTFLLHEIKTAIVLGVPNFRSLRYKFLLFFMSSFQGILTLFVQWKYMLQTTHKSVFFLFFFQVSMLSKRGFLGPLWVHYFNHIYAVNILCFIYTVKIVKYCNIYLYHIFEGLKED